MINKTEKPIQLQKVQSFPLPITTPIEAAIHALELALPHSGPGRICPDVSPLYYAAFVGLIALCENTIARINGGFAPGSQERQTITAALSNPLMIFFLLCSIRNPFSCSNFPLSDHSLQAFASLMKKFSDLRQDGVNPARASIAALFGEYARPGAFWWI